MKKLLAAFLSLLGLSLTPILDATPSLGELEVSFLQPPPTARPWVYWFIMDGNVSREGITADLEAMQRVGIGGVILMEVNVDVPRGPVKFMSDEWRALFKHAVEEAERLGLQITLNAGPGWTGSGGPWVKPEQSMQHLVGEAIQVSGPAKFERILPQPKPREPYFGKGGLTPEMIRAQESFYVDVAVLAFPGGTNLFAQIADLDEKALYLRHPYSSKPGTKPFLPSPAVAASGQVEAVSRARIADLTGCLQPDGRLIWTIPPGEWTILRLGRTSTGANTRPAPQPGLGLESDKFDPAALDAHFDAFVGSLMRTLGPRPKHRTSGWTMLHIDSWEMGAQNWTAKFRNEFQTRRGYDPLLYLPAYTGRAVESLEISERFLWDVRLTAQELVIENHAMHLKQLGRRHGFGLSIEPYDMNPTADLALGAVADVPMCEFWAAGDGFVTAFSCIEATSIAHTHGRPIVAAEAFTGGGKESWTRHPGTMKNQADWAFAAGINRLAFHRFAHQPWTNRAPGMTMASIGTQYERTQTWWEMSGAWHEYLARCQHLLRQGLPVADILYLTPEGAPHVFLPPPSALAGTTVMPDRRGYNFDGGDPQTLIERVRVRRGRLVLLGGMSYGVLVLPAVETMTPALLRKVKALLEAGATVIGPRPIKSPSLTDYPRCDEAVGHLADRLWGPRPVDGGLRKIGKGQLIATAVRAGGSSAEPNALYPDYAQVANLLATLHVQPDFESEPRLRYTHRHLADAELYFVSNPSNVAVVAQCTFRVGGRRAELWDPVTGQIVDAGNVEKMAGQSRLALRLDAYGSIFVVFRSSSAAQPSAAPTIRPQRMPESAMEITGPWDVRFLSGRGAPASITLDRLISWSSHTNSAVRNYSGVASYRMRFDLPEVLRKGPAPGLYIDLGDVQVMAEVILNGRSLGTRWCEPYRVDISSGVKPNAD